jgi:crossover junction endodeoxyribonuclease RuvC
MGFGVASKQGSRIIPHACGTLKFDTKVTANERLLEIYRGVRRLVEQYQPTHLAIEKVFFAKNVVSALKLGQARGVAILAVCESNIPVFEYSANEVKASVVGFGHADKEQVAKMVSRLTGITQFTSHDSSDALAIAICHLNSYRHAQRLAELTKDL